MKSKALILSLINILFVVFSLSAQYVQVGNKLVGTGGISPSSQGSSISLSSDGKTLAVGARVDNGFIGATWVYTFSGGNWVQVGSKLVGSGGVGNQAQGNSISISSDGKILAVGGYNDNGGIGATWVFSLSGSNWTQLGSKLVGAGFSGLSHQGSSISLSSDGQTLAIGGPADDTNIGATWVYTFTGGNWTQVGNKLVGIGGVGLLSQGGSVSLSADGKTLAIGGPTDDYNTGATWVYTFTGSNWTQIGDKLVGTGAIPISNQGNSISLSADGKTLAVGGFYDNGGIGGIGSTWVYTFSGGNWTQMGTKLIGTGGVGYPNQGGSVCLSADGKTLAIGGQGDNGNKGTTWLFTLSGTNWTQLGNKLIGSNGIGNQYQGSSVSFSADGKMLAIGGYYDNGGIGATWIFENNSIITYTQNTNIPEEAQIEIFPNPSNNSFSINSDCICLYSITDVHSNTLETGNTFNKTMGEGLKSGIYFLNIENKVYKIVKTE